MTRRRIMILLLFAGLAACVTHCAHPKGSAAGDDRTMSGREFVQLLADGRFSNATARFDDTMKKAMSTAQLEQMWQTLIRQKGSFQGIVGAQRGQKGGYDLVDVTCEFANGKLNLQVVFDSAGRVSGLWIQPATDGASAVTPEYTPPAYVQRDRFEEKEITVGQGGEWALPGTLTIPKGKGPFPAVVLVHGSGPNGRDETLGPNKPFRDIAWGLASKGIAVLRYDKRTKVHAPRMAGMVDTLTVKEEVIDDALAAVALARKSDRIDTNKVFVLGHSLGGMVAPRIGKADPKIAGLIVLAGPTRPFEDIILEQMTYIYSLQGTMSAEAKKEIEKLKQQVANVKSPKLTPKTPASTLPLGVPAPYWLDLRGYQPAEMARSLMQTMLILQGGRDYQVTEADFKDWKAALSSRKDVTFKLYPDLNHLFMTGKGKAVPAEYNNPGFVSETVVNDVANWIKQR